MRGITHWRAVLVLALVFAALPAGADPLQLPELMHRLAGVKARRAHFVEERRIGVLDVPLRSLGELVYAAPDRLEKRTLQPRPEDLRLDGDILTIVRPDKQPVTIDIRNYPQAAALIASVRGTLAGDVAALEQFYRIELHGTLTAWQLQLVPRDGQMRDLFSDIEIDGERDDVRLIRYDQPNGDHAVMTIARDAER
ncbi:MAG: outer membrane lipoprotein carrier protein LolA [Betaproteobacteria bacterium]|nr:outer membrane lipoprotein carrier protein LolA [Betaproteobacteria bacterium]